MIITIEYFMQKVIESHSILSVVSPITTSDISVQRSVVLATAAVKGAALSTVPLVCSRGVGIFKGKFCQEQLSGSTILDNNKYCTLGYNLLKLAIENAKRVISSSVLCSTEVYLVHQWHSLACCSLDVSFFFIYLPLYGHKRKHFESR